MRPRNAALSGIRRIPADVGMPQQATDGRLHCQSEPSSAIVATGRTQAVYFLQRRFWGLGSPAFQEYWSRGCRRARVLFLHFAWLPLWQHVQRKKKKSYLLKSRYQPSLPTLANTSDLVWRADQRFLARHAVFPDIDLQQYYSGNLNFLNGYIFGACSTGLLEGIKPLRPFAFQRRDTCNFETQPSAYYPSSAYWWPARPNQSLFCLNRSLTNTDRPSLPNKAAGLRNSRSTRIIQSACHCANAIRGKKYPLSPLQLVARNACQSGLMKMIRKIHPAKLAIIFRGNLFILQGGLSARLDLMLNMAAVPPLKDRSLC